MLSGPHLFNFLDIAAQLRDAQALAEVVSAEELVWQLQCLLIEAESRRRMGAAGISVLRANHGALKRLLGGMDSLLQRQ
ncbi:3-deoxy-D-manno-octulosonic acid transferase [compost metagenome]